MYNYITWLSLKALNFQVSAKLESGMQPIKEKNENSDYKGDEMGDDIKNIDLSCPVANAAASKIQVYFILCKVYGP